jgi:hypothetical protein
MVSIDPATVVLGGPGSFKDLLDWGEDIATNLLVDPPRMGCGAMGRP